MAGIGNKHKDKGVTEWGSLARKEQARAKRAMNKRREIEREVAEDLFGPRAHDEHNPTHSKRDGHYCHDWDGLWICADCPEYDVCICECGVCHLSQGHKLDCPRAQ